MDSKNHSSENASTSVVKVSSLMQGNKKVILKHGEKPYLLSITRSGKLILTAHKSEIDTQVNS